MWYFWLLLYWTERKTRSCNNEFDLLKQYLVMVYQVFYYCVYDAEVFKFLIIQNKVNTQQYVSVQQFRDLKSV